MHKFNYLLTLILIAFFVSCQQGSSLVEETESTPKGVHKKSSEHTGTATLDLKIDFENQYYFRGEGEESDYIFLYLDVVGKAHTATVDRTPLNISVVIDRSGSMEDAGKFEFVKQACNTIISHLGEEDRLSIVAYETGVQVIQSSAAITNKNMLKDKVNRLSTGGSTNLSGGMLQGYQEVKHTFKKNYVNRVLLLSDGLANQGIKEPVELKAIAKKHYGANKSVALSTFGVGADFNEDLMTNLAEHGRGNYYFIDQADQINTIFQEELQGLLSVVAKNTRLRVEFPHQYLGVEKVFGYDFEEKNNQLIIDYNDVFAKEEKAILIKFKIKKEIDNELGFEVLMSYDDVLENSKPVEFKKTLSLPVTEDKALYEKSVNTEVYRNKLLYVSNEKFEEATHEVDKGNYEHAKKLMETNIQYLYDGIQLTPVASSLQRDSVIQLQLKTNEKYFKDIDKLKEKSLLERKLYQKSNKSFNYKMKKKKF